MSHEARLASLGLSLPPVPPPVATYLNAVRSGGLLFLSGKGPAAEGGRLPSGRVGVEFSVEEGYRLARSTGLALLAVLRAELGSLDRVRRIVKVLGMVAAPPEFRDHPKVVDGCSDLMVEVFGDAGRHARSAVGVSSLPFGTPVEIEMIAEVD
ncbi:MAG TPA: RidA family protein [Anaeromyxobacteraceae bacterium]|nr:RidA family protein [Anaeromyxobacteraceae bacterium]